MSHVLKNDTSFFCSKCMKRKPVAEKSTRKAGNTSICVPCKTAIETLFKSRQKGLKK